MERRRLRTNALKPGTACTLTNELIKDFSSLLKRGLPTDGVCDYLGLQSRTFWLWNKKGIQFINGDGKPDKYKVYGLFVHSIKRAFAEYRLKLVDQLHKPKAEESWSQALAILERRDRKTFSRHTIELSAEEGYDPDQRFL